MTNLGKRGGEGKERGGKETKKSDKLLLLSSSSLKDALITPSTRECTGAEQRTRRNRLESA